MLGWCAPVVEAREWMCDPTTEDCRAPLVDLIRRESAGIDVAFWLMTDLRFADEIVRRREAGVPVRVLTDSRSERRHSDALQRLRASGIPIRLLPTGAELGWTLMIFTGQRVVQFGGGGYAAEGFTPHPSVVGTAVAFSDHPAVVDDWMARYGEIWTRLGDMHGELLPALSPPRVPPTATDDTELHVVGVDTRRRLITHLEREPLGVDAVVSRLSDAVVADALLAARARGVIVRIVTARAAYRDADDPWHAWNVDRLHAAGVELRVVPGVMVDGALVVFRGLGVTMLGSAGWTGHAAVARIDHGYLTTRPSVYSWTINHVERRWHNATGVVETSAFVPLPPDAPAQVDGAGDSTDGAAGVLRWQAGPWAHRADIYFGASSGALHLVMADLELDVGRSDAPAAWIVPGLQPGTPIYWQVVSRTMAGLEAVGPVWVASLDYGDAAPGHWVPPPSEPSVWHGERSGAASSVPADVMRSRRPPAGGSSGGTRVAREAVRAPQPPPVAPCAFCGDPSLGLPPAPGAFGPRPLPDGEVPRDLSLDDSPMPPDPAAPVAVDVPNADGPAGGGDVAERDGYPGREPSAAWRTQALDRIDRIRKADVALRVVTSGGEPVEGASVRLRMTRHRFAFGSAVTAHDLTADTENARRYRALVERSFNRVVLENDLKWFNWMRTDSTFYNRDNTYRALDWLRDRGIEVRGHYVTWGKLEGERRLERYPQLGPEAFRASLLRDGEEIVTAIGDRVAEWDVVNHPNGRDEGTLLDLLGPTFYDDVFRGVAEWRPDVRRFINEGDVLSATRFNRTRYHDLIAQMLARGAPLQGIGIMGHFFSDDELVSPEELLQVFDRYATFGLPIQVTEFDYWTRNEALQGDFTRDFLIAAFSHPAVEGVLMWGFWEGRHWHPPAALYRQDWSVKPNGRAWEQLVLHDWWTDTAGLTDEDGVYTARGFHGAYEVEVRAGGIAMTCALDLGPDGVDGEVRLDAGTCRIGVDSRDDVERR